MLKENPLLVSCLEKLLRTTPTLADHLVSMGYLERILKRINPTDHTPSLLLLLMSKSTICIDSINLTMLQSTINNPTILESIATIINNASTIKKSSLVKEAINIGLVHQLLDILKHNNGNYFIVDILNNFLKDQDNGGVVKEILDNSQQWKQFNHNYLLFNEHSNKAIQ